LKADSTAQEFAADWLLYDVFWQNIQAAFYLGFLGAKPFCLV